MIQNGDETRQTIEQLLDSIIPTGDLNSILYDHKYCLFLHNVMSYSFVGKTADFICMAIFFIELQFFLVMLTFPRTNFYSLNDLVNNGEFDSADFINVRTSTQQISLIVICVVIIVFVFQWICIFQFYHGITRLNRKAATAFHFTVYHLPLFMVPPMGILFSANIICNSNQIFSLRSAILLMIFLLLAFILMLTNHIIFYYFSRFSLSLTSGYFSFWAPPLNSIDLIYAFLLSTAVFFRGSIFEKTVTAAGIVSIIYGVYTIRKFKNSEFIFSTAKYFRVNFSLNSIVCGIITITSIWTEFPFFLSATITFLSIFITSIISYLIVSPLQEIPPTGLTADGLHNYFSKIQTPFQALYTLRLGTIYAVKEISDPSFLKWIAFHRFSVDSLPDIIRLCCVKKIPLNTIFIPKRIFSGTEMYSLNFLAFQTKVFHNMQSPNEHPDVQLAAKMLEKQYDHAEELIDNFWTESDIKQMNIFQFGSQIRKISDEFSRLGSIFVRSRSIRGIWDKYTDELLNLHSAFKLQRNCLINVLYPLKSIYSFLVEENNENNKEKKPPKLASDKTELEKYMKTFQMWNIVPMFTVFTIVVILLIFGSMYFVVNSNMQTKKSWDFFTNVTNMMKASVVIANSFLVSLDNIYTYPTTEIITHYLNISDEEARIFRSQRISLVDYSINLSQILCKIPLLKSTVNPNEGCPPISYALLSKYNMPSEASIGQRLCYFFSNMYFADQLRVNARTAVADFRSSLNLNYIEAYTPLIIVLSIFFLLFLFVFLFFDKKLHMRFLKAVTHIACTDSNKVSNERSDYSFAFSNQFLIMFAMLLDYSLIYIGHIHQLNDFQRKIGMMANITHGFCFSASQITTVMSSVLLNSLDINGTTDFLSRNRKYCNEVLIVVNNITHDVIPDVFTKVPILNHWTAPNKTSFNSFIHDWCVIATTENKSPESFLFLYTRYTFMKNFTFFFHESIPAAIDNVYLAMLQQSFYDWWVSVAGIILAVFLYACFIFLHRRKKTWYYGASLILRRKIYKNHVFVSKARRILENKNQPMLDVLPVAAVVRDRNLRIIASNWIVHKFTKFSENQLFGQKIEEVFDLNSNKFEYQVFQNQNLKNNDENHNFINETNRNDANGNNMNENGNNTYGNENNSNESESIGNDNIDNNIDKSNINENIMKGNNNLTGDYFDVVIFKDSTGISELAKARKAILDRFHSPITGNMPVQKEMVYIEFRTLSNSADPERTFNLMKRIEHKYPFVRRISIGCTFYSAVCEISEIENKKSKLFELANEVFRAFDEKIVLVMTTGIITLFSLFDKGDSLVVACGRAVTRAHDVIVFGFIGRKYVDYGLFDEEDFGDFSDYFIPISSTENIVI